jgi:hypothetical protein
MAFMRRIQAVISGLLPLLALLIVPGVAAAQNIDSPYRFLDTRQAVGVFAGQLLTSRGALGLGPRSGPILGVRYDLGISGPFVLEADLGWFAKSRAVQDTVPGDTTRASVGDVDFRAITAQASLRFNITGPRTWHGILPYVLFGGGITTDVSGDAEPDASLPADVRFDFGTSFTGVLGAGFEWYPGESGRAGIRLDARNLLWKLKTPGAFLRGDQARILPSDEWAQNFALTAGVVFRF